MGRAGEVGSKDIVLGIQQQNIRFLQPAQDLPALRQTKAPFNRTLFVFRIGRRDYAAFLSRSMSRSILRSSSFLIFSSRSLSAASRTLSFILPTALRALPSACLAMPSAWAFSSPVHSPTWRSARPAMSCAFPLMRSLSMDTPLYLLSIVRSIEIMSYSGEGGVQVSPVL